MDEPIERYMDPTNSGKHKALKDIPVGAIITPESISRNCRVQVLDPDGKESRCLIPKEVLLGLPAHRRKKDLSDHLTTVEDVALGAERAQQLFASVRQAVQSNLAGTPSADPLSNPFRRGDSAREAILLSAAADRKVAFQENPDKGPRRSAILRELKEVELTDPVTGEKGYLRGMSKAERATLYLRIIAAAVANFIEIPPLTEDPDV